MLSLQLQTTSRHSCPTALAPRPCPQTRRSTARTPPGVPGLPVAVEPVRAVGREGAAMPKKQEGAQKAPSRGRTSPPAALGALLCRGPAVARGKDELCEERSNTSCLALRFRSKRIYQNNFFRF